jgi:xanthine dehydrogenase accessory factor
VNLSFYRQFAAALNQGAAVVATVIRIQGSVPREVGAKLLVCKSGVTIGTIGGGAGEAKVIQQATNVMNTGAKQLVTVDLSGSPQRETQGICGGLMQVWLERWQGAAAIALVEQILTLLEAGQPVMLVTPLAQARSPYLEESAGSGQKAELDAAFAPFAPSPQFPLSCFTEILQPPPLLLIVGAGHCGIQLAKVADLIGFQVMVQDDRPEWANSTHYPQATRIFTQSIEAAVDQLAQHEQLYVALVTRGYQYDLAALTLLLQRGIPCNYIGMIGSQKRVRQVFQAVENGGIAAEKVRSVYAPIGLDIGALTPEEIAVSISAELILVRRGGSGRPLSRLWV